MEEFKGKKEKNREHHATSLDIPRELAKEKHGSANIGSGDWDLVKSRFDVRPVTDSSAVHI